MDKPSKGWKEIIPINAGRPREAGLFSISAKSGGAVFGKATTEVWQLRKYKSMKASRKPSETGMVALQFIEGDSGSWGLRHKGSSTVASVMAVVRAVGMKSGCYRGRKERAGMVWTDPPYNVRYGESKNPRHKIRQIEGDWQTPDEWSAFVHAFGEQIKGWCDGDVYVWGASAPDGMKMRLWLIEMGMHWSATIIWNKQQLVLSPAKYQRKYEPCLYGWFSKKSSFVGDRTHTEVWEINRPLSSPEHPTMKPIETATKAIENSSRKGDIVLDLFAGSGTCLIACEQLDRSCRAIEMVPAYAAVTLQRWTDLTGREPVCGSG